MNRIIFLCSLAIATTLSTACKFNKVKSFIPQEVKPVVLFSHDELKYSYIDFPFEDMGYRWPIIYHYELLENGERHGETRYGFKEGEWITGRFSIDSFGNYYPTFVRREEYFKHGLRDSIYKIYNKKQEILYSSMFNMGTGILKDFHPNGQLYYSITTKDGYFTDTLVLYNDQGIIKEKFFYIKDSLAYYKKYID